MNLIRRGVVAVAVALTALVARAEEFPKATLQKGDVSIDLYLPDPHKGFYQGLRYDHSGMVAQARWHGHTFFGELMKPHDPKIHDHGAGTVEEFGMEFHRPLGYDAAKVGGPFLKIGVGVLAKSDDPKYGFNKDYKVLQWPAWRVSTGPDWAEFAQSAALPGGRVAYELVKRIEVTTDGFRIVRRLKNTGGENWATDHYGHNYISIDEKPVGPEYVVKVGYDPKLAEQRGDGDTTVAGRDVRVSMLLPEKKKVWMRLEGFGDSPRDNLMRVEHEVAGVGVEISTDRPIRRWVLFAMRSAICPEAFVEWEVAPGQTVEWTTVYRFYARP